LRPTPAPARQAAAPVQAPAAPLEEEAASWEKLVSDTEDPTAYLDTTPKSGKRSGVSRKGLSGSRLQAPAVSSRRLWIVVGAATAAVVLLVGLIILIAIALSSPGPKTQQGQTQRSPLRVDPASDEKGVYKTIQQAVIQAHTNDHILLMTDITEGTVNVSRKENLVIESGPGRPVTWKFKDGAAERNTEKRMLGVTSAPGFELKRVNLDGAQRADVLVVLYGICPDLKLSDIEFRFFNKYGVFVNSCDGQAGQPVILSNLHFTTTDPSQTGISFDYPPGRSVVTKPQYVTIQSCSFEGKGAVMTTTNFDDVKEVKLEAAGRFTLAPPKKQP
jgi:hypothetical protein